jgi:hypothetical protein
LLAMVLPKVCGQVLRASCGGTPLLLQEQHNKHQRKGACACAVLQFGSCCAAPDLQISDLWAKATPLRLGANTGPQFAWRALGIAGHVVSANIDCCPPHRLSVTGGGAGAGAGGQLNTCLSVTGQQRQNAERLHCGQSRMIR